MKLNVGLLKQLIKEELDLDSTPLIEEPEQLDEKSILKNKYPFKAIFYLWTRRRRQVFLVKANRHPQGFCRFKS